MRVQEDGASRHWHRLLLAYSLLRLGPASSVLGTIPEAVYNLWVRDNEERGVDDLTQEIDHFFINV